MIEVFARSPHCATVQSQLNVFGWSARVLELAAAHDLAVLARSPLAMGLLSGRYTRDRRPAPGDVRLDTPWWTYFDDDAIGDWLGRLEQVRALLTIDGRTLVQGALGYLWALHPAVIPLPGIRTPNRPQRTRTLSSSARCRPTRPTRSLRCWPTRPSGSRTRIVSIAARSLTTPSPWVKGKSERL